MSFYRTLRTKKAMPLRGDGLAADRLMFDVAIVGGGPAGLSAALMLGRCRRRVVVFDLGLPRNRRAAGLHGDFTRGGIGPAEVTEIGPGGLAAVRVRPPA